MMTVSQINLGRCRYVRTVYGMLENGMNALHPCHPLPVDGADVDDVERLVVLIENEVRSVLGHV